MNRRREVVLWVAQRATAVVLAFCVIVHLATIIYAVRGGLSAADILARTRGSIVWASLYSIFVVAAAVHAAIGVRNVLTEWSPLRDRSAGIFATVFGASLLLLGLRAVAAVVLS